MSYRVLVIGSDRFAEDAGIHLRGHGYEVHRRPGIGEVLTRSASRRYQALVLDGTRLTADSAFFDTVLQSWEVLPRLIVIAPASPGRELLLKLLTLNVYAVIEADLPLSCLTDVVEDVIAAGWHAGTRWFSSRDRSPFCRDACAIWEAGEACAEMDDKECLVVLPEYPSNVLEEAPDRCPLAGRFTVEES